VFLSACRSGSGRPTADGTIGLARAFLIAGATAVVGSLWNVPDASTRLLVQHFYDAALSSADAADALRAAAVATRASLAEGKGVSVDDVHPAAWGAFFLLGRGGLSL
jgi:CHAT domain-containing protein